MNNTFTYAIDERNLRIQLRSIETAPSAEAWEKFEGFADANPFRAAKRPLEGFHVSLNRNIVLPAVFAVVICLFSLLLLNFVSIKNPPVQNTQKAELSPVVPQPVVAEKQTVAAIQPEQVKSEVVKVEASSPAQSQLAKETSPVPAETAAVTSPVNNAAITATENTPIQQPVTEVKKRKKKEITIEEQIRPTTFTDETESEEEVVEIPN